MLTLSQMRSEVFSQQNCTVFHGWQILKCLSRSEILWIRGKMGGKKSPNECAGHQGVHIPSTGTGLTRFLPSSAAWELSTYCISSTAIDPRSKSMTTKEIKSKFKDLSGILCCIFFRSTSHERRNPMKSSLRVALPHMACTKEGRGRYKLFPLDIVCLEELNPNGNSVRESRSVVWIKEMCTGLLWICKKLWSCSPVSADQFLFQDEKV